MFEIEIYFQLDYTPTRRPFRVDHSDLSQNAKPTPCLTPS